MITYDSRQFPRHWHLYLPVEPGFVAELNRHQIVAPHRSTAFDVIETLFAINQPRRVLNQSTACSRKRVCMSHRENSPAKSLRPSMPMHGIAPREGISSRMSFCARRNAGMEGISGPWLLPAARCHSTRRVVPVSEPIPVTLTSIPPRSVPKRSSDAARPSSKGAQRSSGIGTP
jgi:hypothetical protein